MAETSMPPKSITRFLLPMSDVMLVLFSMFLLTPHLNVKPGEKASKDLQGSSNYWTPEQQQDVREELNRLRQLVEESPAKRYHTVTLTVNEKDGSLLWTDMKGKQWTFTEDNAERLIAQHREEAQTNNRELCYIISYHADALFPGVRHLEVVYPSMFKGKADLIHQESK